MDGAQLLLGNMQRTHLIWIRSVGLVGWQWWTFDTGHSGALHQGRVFSIWTWSGRPLNCANNLCPRRQRVTGAGKAQKLNYLLGGPSEWVSECVGGDWEHLIKLFILSPIDTAPKVFILLLLLRVHWMCSVRVNSPTPTHIYKNWPDTLHW